MTGLRRTALTRKTPLRRTPFPRSTTSTPARAKTTMRRLRRGTGPSTAERLTVAMRARGCCELCGVDLYAVGRSHSFHHRQPRGMGGSSRPERNAAYNLLLVCGDATSPDGCHAFIESHRKAAIGEGWLVPHPIDPAGVPVTIHGTGPVLLTVDGRYEAVAS